MLDTQLRRPSIVNANEVYTCHCTETSLHTCCRSLSPVLCSSHVSATPLSILNSDRRRRLPYRVALWRAAIRLELDSMTK